MSLQWPVTAALQLHWTPWVPEIAAQVGDLRALSVLPVASSPFSPYLSQSGPSIVKRALHSINPQVHRTKWQVGASSGLSLVARKTHSGPRQRLRPRSNAEAEAEAGAGAEASAVAVASRSRENIDNSSTLDDLQSFSKSPSHPTEGQPSNSLRNHQQQQQQQPLDSYDYADNSSYEPGYNPYAYPSQYLPGRKFGQQQHKNKKPVYVSIKPQTVNGLLSLVLLFSVSVCGCIGTIFMISALTVIESLQTRGNCYLVSLALAHLLVTLLVIPSSAIQIMAGDGINGNRLCHYQWLTLEFSLIVSQLSFLLIAADNYLGYKCSEKITASIDLAAEYLRQQQQSKFQLCQQQSAGQLRPARGPFSGPELTRMENTIQRQSNWADSSEHPATGAQQQQLQQSLMNKQSPVVGAQFGQRRGWIGGLIGGDSHTTTAAATPPKLTLPQQQDNLPADQPELRLAHQFAGQPEARFERPGFFSYRNCCGRLKVLVWISLVWSLAFAYTIHQHNSSYGPHFCTVSSAKQQSAGSQASNSNLHTHLNSNSNSNSNGSTSSGAAATQQANLALQQQRLEAQNRLLLGDQTNGPLRARIVRAITCDEGDSNGCRGAINSFAGESWTPLETIGLSEKSSSLSDPDQLSAARPTGGVRSRAQVSQRERTSGCDQYESGQKLGEVKRATGGDLEVDRASESSSPNDSLEQPTTKGSREHLAPKLRRKLSSGAQAKEFLSPLGWLENYASSKNDERPPQLAGAGLVGRDADFGAQQATGLHLDRSSFRATSALRARTKDSPLSESTHLVGRITGGHKRANFQMGQVRVRGKNWAANEEEAHYFASPDNENDKHPMQTDLEPAADIAVVPARGRREQDSSQQPANKTQLAQPLRINSSVSDGLLALDSKGSLDNGARAKQSRVKPIRGSHSKLKSEPIECELLKHFGGHKHSRSLEAPVKRKLAGERAERSFELSHSVIALTSRAEQPRQPDDNEATHTDDDNEKRVGQQIVRDETETQPQASLANVDYELTLGSRARARATDFETRCDSCHRNTGMNASKGKDKKSLLSGASGSERKRARRLIAVTGRQSSGRNCNPGGNKDNNANCDSTSTGDNQYASNGASNNVGQSPSAGDKSGERLVGKIATIQRQPVDGSRNSRDLAIESPNGLGGSRTTSFDYSTGFSSYAHNSGSIERDSQVEESRLNSRTSGQMNSLPVNNARRHQKRSLELSRLERDSLEQELLVDSVGPKLEEDVENSSADNLMNTNPNETRRMQMEHEVSSSSSGSGRGGGGSGTGGIGINKFSPPREDLDIKSSTVPGDNLFEDEPTFAYTLVRQPFGSATNTRIPRYLGKLEAEIKRVRQATAAVNQLIAHNSSETSNNGANNNKDDDTRIAGPKLYWLMLFGTIVGPTLLSTILFARAYFRMKAFKTRHYNPLPLDSIGSMLPVATQLLMVGTQQVASLQLQHHQQQQQRRQQQQQQQLQQQQQQGLQLPQSAQRSASDCSNELEDSKSANSSNENDEQSDGSERDGKEKADDGKESDGNDAAPDASRLHAPEALRSQAISGLTEAHPSVNHSKTRVCQSQSQKSSDDKHIENCSKVALEWPAAAGVGSERATRSASQPSESVDLFTAKLQQQQQQQPLSFEPPVCPVNIGHLNREQLAQPTVAIYSHASTASAGGGIGQQSMSLQQQQQPRMAHQQVNQVMSEPIGYFRHPQSAQLIEQTVGRGRQYLQPTATPGQMARLSPLPDAGSYSSRQQSPNGQPLASRSNRAIQRDTSFSAPPSATFERESHSNELFCVQQKVVDEQVARSANVEEQIQHPQQLQAQAQHFQQRHSFVADQQQQQLQQQQQQYEFRRRQFHAQSFHHGCPVRSYVQQNGHASENSNLTSFFLAEPRASPVFAPFQPRLEDHEVAVSSAHLSPVASFQHEQQSLLERHCSLPRSSRLSHRSEPVGRQPVPMDAVPSNEPTMVGLSQNRRRKPSEQQQQQATDSANILSALTKVIKPMDEHSTFTTPTISHLPTSSGQQRVASKTLDSHQERGQTPTGSRTNASEPKSWLTNRSSPFEASVKKSTSGVSDRKAVLYTYSNMTDDQLLKSNIIVFALNLTLWLPFIVLTVVAQYRDHLTQELKDGVWWTATLNCCSCSYVYALTNKDFREAFNKLFYYCCCKSHVTFPKKTPIFRSQLDMDSNGTLRVHVIPGLNVYTNKSSNHLVGSGACSIYGGSFNPLAGSSSSYYHHHHQTSSGAMHSHERSAGSSQLSPASNLHRHYMSVGGGFGGPFFAATATSARSHDSSRSYSSFNQRNTRRQRPTTTASEL